MVFMECKECVVFVDVKNVWYLWNVKNVLLVLWNDGSSVVPISLVKRCRSLIESMQYLWNVKNLWCFMECLECMLCVP